MDNPSVLRTAVMRFAELIDEVGKRLHVGCVMAVGQDWVEVSLPEHFQLGDGMSVRFPPSLHSHGVEPGWRSADRVGLTYVAEGPSPEQFSCTKGLIDPRPAQLKRRR